MSQISALKPQPLWQYFYQLCQIPRPSKHEEKAVAWLRHFASNRSLECKQDDVGNVIIFKPAYQGFEDAETVILQSHIDMVPQKNAETEHDFKSDPIQAYVDGEWVTAKGTTLGADNGIGVAAILAVLDSNEIKHGPIEALITVDEEAGMTGAMGLDPTILKGSLLFNLDTEDDGELYVGCAGGQDVNIDLSFDAEAVDHSNVAWELSVKGLLGGHSGVDIHLTRANANKLMNRVIRRLLQSGIELNVAKLKGGSLRNAIARESFATILLPVEQQDELLNVLEDITVDIYEEWKGAEPNLSINAKPCATPKSQVPIDVVLRLLRAIDAVPHGVSKMSTELEGIVETSNNLAVIRLDDGVLKVRCLVRSLIDTARDEYSEAVGAAFWLAGAQVSFHNPYPGWSPNMDSPLISKLSKVHMQLFGIKPKIKVIHAGLECGLLGSIYPNWDMISFGPTIRGAHSPDERVEIVAVERFWMLLVAALEKVASK